MEADWEVYIGPEAPIIEVCWPGFVDLRHSPELARQLPEATDLPSLADALVRLNGEHSSVWTAKCDVWPVLDLGQIDAYEMDAPIESLVHAWGCYIDLLPKDDEQWIAPGMAVSWSQGICERLRTVPLPCCRVDLVVRSAVITQVCMEIGVTAYLISCGPTAEEASQSLQKVLGRFVDALCGAQL